MELKDAILARASVRQFKDEAIDPEKLKFIAEMGSKAPSVNNSQPWKFIAITHAETLKCMAQAVHSKINLLIPTTANEEEAKAKSQVEWFSTFFGNAPAVIAVLGTHYEAVVDKALGDHGLSHDTVNELRNHPDIQSIGACVQNMLLAAADIGLGACWLSGPLVAKDDIEECLDIRTPYKLAALIAIGYPAAEPKQREKKQIEEIYELRS